MLRRAAALALLLPALLGLFVVAMLAATADERMGKDRFFLDCFEEAAGAWPSAASTTVRAAAAERYGPAYADCPLIRRDAIVDAEDAAFARQVAARPGGVIWSSGAANGPNITQRRRPRRRS